MQATFVLFVQQQKTWKTAQDEREAKVKEAEKRVRDLEDERQRLDKGIESKKDNNNNKETTKTTYIK